MDMPRQIATSESQQSLKRHYLQKYGSSKSGKENAAVNYSHFTSTSGPQYIQIPEHYPAQVSQARPPIQIKDKHSKQKGPAFHPISPFHSQIPSGLSTNNQSVDHSMVGCSLTPQNLMPKSRLTHNHSQQLRRDSSQQTISTSASRLQQYQDQFILQMPGQVQNSKPSQNDRHYLSTHRQTRQPNISIISDLNTNYETIQPVGVRSHSHKSRNREAQLQSTDLTTMASIQNTLSLFNHTQDPIQQFPKQKLSHNQEPTHKQRNHSKAKINIKHFVKKTIRGRVHDLTLKDSIFDTMLKPFIDESSNFLQNSEKHYRIKFVMDLADAIASSTQAYLSASQFSQDQQQLKVQQQKFKLKVARFTICEEELRLKIKEFESAFSVLSSLKSTYDLEKKSLVQGYLAKTRYGNKATQSVQVVECEMMSVEDDRSKMAAFAYRLKEKENTMDHKLADLKLDQLKLGDDIKEFMAIQAQFEKQRILKMEKLNSLEEEYQMRFEQLEEEFQIKENILKNYKDDLKKKEKVITELIMRNDESLLLKSYTLSNDDEDESSGDEGTISDNKKSNFNDVQNIGGGQRRELRDKEKLLTQFLSSFDREKLDSTGSLMNLESLRASIQTPRGSSMNQPQFSGK